MKKDLNYLLFKKEIYQKGIKEKKPFFRFQNDLAEAIINSPGHYDQKELKNMRPYLNQVLKAGGMAYEKPMSEKLKDKILQILKERLSKKDPLYDNLNTVFNEAYALLKQKGNSHSPSTINGDYKELMEWSLKANLFVTLLHEPGEIFWSANRKTKNDVDYLLNRLTEIVFKNFIKKESEILAQLRKGKIEHSSKKENIDSYSYNVYLPNYKTGITFWQKLFQFFLFEKLELKASDPSLLRVIGRFFKMINENCGLHNQGIIRVFKIDPKFTPLPILYCQSYKGIEYESSTSHEELFVMNLNKGIVEEVLKLSGNSLDTWKENIYYPLIQKDTKNVFNVSEVRFSDYEQEIISSISL